MHNLMYKNILLYSFYYYYIFIIIILSTWIITEIDLRLNNVLMLEYKKAPYDRNNISF